MQKPRQQDGLRREIQVATEWQQTSDSHLEQHRRLQEEVLKELPMTTTLEDFQKLIRAEKDKQHMYTQDQDWTSVIACMMKVKSLTSRQAGLGELG